MYKHFFYSTIFSRLKKDPLFCHYESWEIEEASFSKKYHGLFERIIAPLRANDVQMTFN